MLNKYIKTCAQLFINPKYELLSWKTLIIWKEKNKNEISGYIYKFMIIFLVMLQAISCIISLFM